MLFFQKLKLVKGCGYEAYNNKEAKKELDKETKNEEQTEKDEAPVLLVTRVSYSLQPILSNNEVYNNIQQKNKSHQLYAHKSYLSSNRRRVFSEFNGVLQREGYDFGEIIDKYTGAPSSKHFKRRMKMLNGPNGSCCMADWVLIFSPLVKC